MPATSFESGLFVRLRLGLIPSVQDSNEILRPRERLPALRKEVLGHDLLLRQLKDGHAPLIEGVRNLDLEVAFGIQIPDDPVLVGSVSA